MLSPLQKANLKLTFFGIWKIPLLFFCRPKIIEYSPERTVVKIPLRRRTKNHLNSMYFGALAVGADVTGAFIAFDKIASLKKNVSLVFKDFNAEFMVRPMGDVHFICEDGKKVLEMIEETLTTKERVNFPLTITAKAPSINEDVVAKFTLTLSLKYKPKRKFKL